MIIPAKDARPLNICCVGKPVKSFQDHAMHGFCHIQDGADETVSIEDASRKQSRRDSFVDGRHYLPTAAPCGSDNRSVTAKDTQPEKTN